jgi:hypothetical protein
MLRGIFAGLCLFELLLFFWLGHGKSDQETLGWLLLMNMFLGAPALGVLVAALSLAAPLARRIGGGKPAYIGLSAIFAGLLPTPYLLVASAPDGGATLSFQMAGIAAVMGLVGASMSATAPSIPGSKRVTDHSPT